MSIFGERIRRPEPDIGTILSDYAKKDYVDSQDALRVLKAGDTMTGDLDMWGGGGGGEAGAWAAQRPTGLRR